MKYQVCQVEEVPRGEKRSFTIKNIPVVVIHNQKGEFYAIYDRCPHQRAVLSDGKLCGLTVADQPGAIFEYHREGEILRCPWHGFSFDVTTGACLTAEKMRVKAYPLTIEDQKIFLDV